MDSRFLRARDSRLHIRRRRGGQPRGERPERRDVVGAAVIPLVDPAVVEVQRVARLVVVEVGRGVPPPVPGGPATEVGRYEVLSPVPEVVVRQSVTVAVAGAPGG